MTPMGKDESILLEICGGMPSADTRCVGGMFPGKVRRRGHLYYRLKDYPSLQQVLGGFQSAFHCKTAVLSNIDRLFSTGVETGYGFKPDSEQSECDVKKISFVLATR